MSEANPGMTDAKPSVTLRAILLPIHSSGTTLILYRSQRHSPPETSPVWIKGQSSRSSPYVHQLSYPTHAPYVGYEVFNEMLTTTGQPVRAQTAGPVYEERLTDELVPGNRAQLEVLTTTGQVGPYFVPEP